MMGKTSNIRLWREGETTQDDQQHTFMERGELHEMTSNIRLWREGGTTQDDQQHMFMERGRNYTR